MALDDILDELEGLHFDILNDYIQKGETNEMPEEMVLYMKQLEHAHSRLNRGESPMNVIKSLRSFFPELNEITAKSRLDDTLRFFYIDTNDNKKLYNNVLFELSMKAIELAIKTVKTPEQALKVVDAIKKAQEVKYFGIDDEIEIDPRLLEEKTELHTLTPSDVGLPEANKRAIANQIDQMPITEEQKLKIKMDAGVTPRKILNWNNEQTEDTEG
ncbi:hypothetical protein [Winogradskyella pulchriflava]|uniref:Uncharacterized protein n=1 Tax=Winogradskyella pulchriflava TaxID=1110688 RepID=A0ABV6QF52_9FLAO